MISFLFGKFCSNVNSCEVVLILVFEWKELHFWEEAKDFIYPLVSKLFLKVQESL